MQSADILIYRAMFVPVGEDQIPHIEITRRNRPPLQPSTAASRALKKSRSRRQENGQQKSPPVRRTAHPLPARRRRSAGIRPALLADTQNLSIGDRERLFGYLENKGKVILVEPQALLTETSRMPAWMARRCPELRQRHLPARRPAAVAKSARHAHRPGARAPHRLKAARTNARVAAALQVPTATPDWVQSGCRSAGIGCLECKQPVIDGILAEQQPMFERAQQYLDDPHPGEDIVADGCERARAIARNHARRARSHGSGLRLMPACITPVGRQ